MNERRETVFLNLRKRGLPWPWGRIRELCKENARLHEALARAKERRRVQQELLEASDKRVSALRAELRKVRTELPRLLLEPGTGECTKTRLHTPEEAGAFLVRVAESTEQDPSVFRVYRCRVCPRHPATGYRFLHIGHSNATPEGRAAQVESRVANRRRGATAHTDGTTIGQRVSPATLARLQRPQETK